MKRKIILTNYEAGGQGPNGKQQYDVKDIIHKIVLHPTQKHNGFRFYTVAKTANKIKECNEDFIILDSTDYEIVKAAFSSFEGFGANDVELVNRIFEAEGIEEDQK